MDLRLGSFEMREELSQIPPLNEFEEVINDEELLKFVNGPIFTIVSSTGFHHGLTNDLCVVCHYLSAYVY
jgi:hypothetical protein